MSSFLHALLHARHSLIGIRKPEEEELHAEAVLVGTLGKVVARIPRERRLDAKALVPTQMRLERLAVDAPCLEAHAIGILRAPKGVDDFSESRIIKGMVGRELSDRFPKRVPQIGDVLMEVKNWNVYHPQHKDRKVCDDVNIYVRKGEVLGISGLMGAGRTELAMSIFGKSYGENISGEIYINGKKVQLNVYSS